MPKLNWHRTEGTARLPGRLPNYPKSSANNQEIKAVGKLSTAQRFLAWRKNKKHRTFADANAFIAREVKHTLARPDFHEHFYRMPWHKE